MGIETILFAALTGLKAISQMNQAKSQANSIIDEGNLATKEQAKKTRYAAATQTTNFLNSGITLEGTPNSVIDETFKTGQADIKNIANGYNTKAKNTISAGRSAAISTITSGFAGASLGGSMGSMFETAGSYLPESTLYGINSAGGGNFAYDALSLKDARG